jgi:hypothetical protein
VVEGQPISPSSSVTHSTTAALQTPTTEHPPDVVPNDLRMGKVSDEPPQRSHVVRNIRSPSPFRGNVVAHTRQDVKPFYSGEGQGLEFLFDVVGPDRPIKGHHYTTPASTYRAKRTVRKNPRPAQPLPPLPIQRELVRAFFLYVWPMLPVVDAKEFLTAFQSDSNSISPLLLWSVFFAAASVSSPAPATIVPPLTRAVRRPRCPQVASYAAPQSSQGAILCLRQGHF